MNTNRMMSSPATTKFGTAMPTVAIDISEKSSTPPRRTAETTPAVKPSNKANANAINPSVAETGRPAAITSFTEKSAIRKLRPKSKCK